MPLIRVGLIGLSGSPPDKYQGLGWAASAHLPYLLDSDAYALAALCNTSVESARNAVKMHNLPDATKTYGSVEELAADPDIDLVVSCVRVDKHYPTILPCLRLGKAVFVEWPLGANLQEAEEMMALTRKNNARSLIGLQGGVCPDVQKVKELVTEGRIGKVLSSTYTCSMGIGGTTEQWIVDYFTERAVGGNMVTIGVGHAMEYIEYILGNLDFFDSLLLNGRTTVDIVAPDGTVVEKGRKKDVPDQIVFHGKTSNGSLLSFYMRGGQPFPSTPAIDWRIHGETGEIRIISPTPFLPIGHPETKIEVHDHKTGELEVVKPKKHELERLPLPARNIGRLYELFARGEEQGHDFEHAAGKHRLIAELYRRYDAQALLEP